RRPMHLPDRAGGERLRLDALEHVLPGHAELLLHHDYDLGLRQRRNVVLQLLELGDELGRQQVRPSREDLAELREGGTELLERRAEADRALAQRAVARALAEAVLREHLADPQRAAEELAFDLRHLPN